MNTYQDRVKAEQLELAEKLTKLTAFFDTETFSGLDEEDQQLLKGQANAMTTYNDCLIERINRF